jgi:hypothetical protein
MVIINFDSIFNEFCDYLDGKVKWSGRKANITKLIFEFFSKKFEKEKVEELVTEEKEYMRLDYIIRYKPPKYSSNEILLALEHEVSQKKPEILLSKEVQHLVDIKAKYKIGIFYPSTGDEEKLKRKIEQVIKQSSFLSTPWEEYLFIFGSPTTKEGKRSLLLKAFYFSWEGNTQNLKVKSLERKVIAQQYYSQNSLGSSGSSGS